jgi:hypothetical protein
MGMQQMYPSMGPGMVQGGSMMGGPPQAGMRMMNAPGGYPPQGGMPMSSYPPQQGYGLPQGYPPRG